MLKELDQVGALELVSDEDQALQLRLNERTLAPHLRRAAERAIDQRRRFKRQQLAGMVAYATARRCRRETLLAHFASRPLPSDLPCCDVCHPEAASPPSPVASTAAPGLSLDVRLAILGLARDLHGCAGAAALARLLHGSEPDSGVSPTDRNLMAFGRCADHDLGALLAEVGRLVEEGLLKPGPGGAGLLVTKRGQRELLQAPEPAAPTRPEPSPQTATDERPRLRLVRVNDWGLRGICLAYQGRFVGAEYVRTPVGELMYRLKYQGCQELAGELASLCAEALRSEQL
jgi:superfamily II DNA helicase RecQ